MKCLRCGKESPDGAKFCPDCGYQFVQTQNGNIPYQGENNQQYYEAGSNQQQSFGPESTQQQYYGAGPNQQQYNSMGASANGPYRAPGNGQNVPPQKKSGCLKIALICIGVFVFLGILLAFCSSGGGDGKNSSTDSTKSEDTNTSDTKSDDIRDLWNATEDEVCKFFGVEKNEMGMYPSEDNILAYCMNGKVYVLKLSSNDNKYNLCGIKMGDSASTVKEMLKNDRKREK